MKKLFLIGLLLSILIGFSAYATEEFTIKSYVDKIRLNIDNVLTFTVEFSGGARKAPDVKMPKLEDFEVLSTSRSFNISTKGREVSFTKSVSLVLKPTKTGELTIGSATVNYKGKIYKTEPIKVEVIAGAPEEKEKRIIPERKRKIIPKRRKLII